MECNTDNKFVEPEPKHFFRGLFGLTVVPSDSGIGQPNQIYLYAFLTVVAEVPRALPLLSLFCGSAPLTFLNRCSAQKLHFKNKKLEGKW